MIGLIMSLVALGSVIPVYANVEAPSSAAYQEVTVPLDPETRAVGGALYAQHCAACHDGNMVRAPQRYVLENVSPSTLLAAMIDGPMREVAADLSFEQKTAVAEYIAERKITETNTAEAGVACEVVSHARVSALGAGRRGEPFHASLGGARHRKKYCFIRVGLGLCLPGCDPGALATGIRCGRHVRGQSERLGVCL